MGTDKPVAESKGGIAERRQMEGTRLLCKQKESRSVFRLNFLL